jgi:hypothetical protein
MANLYLKKKESKLTYDDLNTEIELLRSILDTINLQKEVGNIYIGERHETEPGPQYDGNDSDDDYDDDDYFSDGSSDDYDSDDDGDGGDDGGHDDDDEFENWKIKHNRLLRHYYDENRPQTSLYSAETLSSEHEDIGIWTDLLNENYELNFSEDNLDELEEKYFHDPDDLENTTLFLIHIYLKEAFFARDILRNIDFKRKLLVLGDRERLYTLYKEEDNYKEHYLKDPSFYNSDDMNIFDEPENEDLIQRELNIANGTWVSSTNVYGLPDSDSDIE